MDKAKPILAVKGSHKIGRNNVNNKKMSRVGLSINTNLFYTYTVKSHPASNFT